MPKQFLTPSRLMLVGLALLALPVLPTILEMQQAFRELGTGEMSQDRFKSVELAFHPVSLVCTGLGVFLLVASIVWAVRRRHASNA
jgi:hypothetical protein